MSLRAMPNLHVFRPADAVETRSAGKLALRRSEGPSLLALSRQNLPQVRLERSDNLTARGAYRLRAASGQRRVVLLATGSEVQVALETAEALEGQGIGADVVSMPCWSLFDAQDEGYRRDVIPGEGALIVSIEAGSTLGWERYTGPNGLNIGLDRFAPPRRRKICSSVSASAPKRSCRASPRPWEIWETRMAVRVAINGFGRIGRLVARAASKGDQRASELVASRSRRMPNPTRCCLSATRSKAPIAGEVPRRRQRSDHRRRRRDQVTAEKDPGEASARRQRHRHSRSSAPDSSSDRDKAGAHLTAGARKSSLSPRQRGVDLPRLRRQSRPSSPRAHDRFQRFVHHQLPGAGRPR
jgi:hypothetical protein